MIKTPLRIVSWNIRKAVGLDWRRDPARVLQVLTDLDPDIVLLQEADKRLPPRPPALPGGMVAEAGWTALDVDPSTPSTGYHGNAILLRTGWTVHQLEGVDLPGFEPRGAILSRIEGPLGTWTIGGAHLGLRMVDRRRQISHLLRAAEAIGGPIVLGGDFNEWRRDPSALLLPVGWRSHAPGATFHASKPVLPLDRFLVGPEVRVAGTHVPAKEDCLRASDHLPIRIDVYL